MCKSNQKNNIDVKNELSDSFLANISSKMDISGLHKPDNLQKIP